MARLLSYPSGVTKAPSSYVASLANMQQLVSDLSNIPTDIAVNIMGEGMSAEYPTEYDVGSYVLEGGVYVDWCGWPMYYANVAGEDYDDPTRFGRFMTSIGVSNQYITSFNTNDVVDQISCTSPPYARMWLSTYPFPFGSSVVVSPGWVTQCSTFDLLNNNIPLYAYDIVGVQAGSGWYFYASNGVDECDLANFIAYCLIYYEPWDCTGSGGSSGSGSGSGGSQPTCTSGTWDPNLKQCVNPNGSASGGTPTCSGGQTWNGTQCVSTSVNWWLIGGIAVAAVGAIGIILAATG